MISVIIPTRNEGKHIERCLLSILDGVSKEFEEVFVIDGMSTDGTKEIIERISNKFAIVKLLLNPDKTIPFALNLGIKNSTCDYILRLDAHSEYAPDYIMNCINAMKETDADNVGGVVKTIQNGNTISAKIIQLISTHSFGVGNSKFRLNPKPHYADTVPFGFFKKSVFYKIGYFDERLTRNQDYEFNQRIIKTGGKIWLDPRIKANYKNQSTFKGLLRQAINTGKYNVWMWRAAPYSFKLRHAIPGFFVLAIVGFLIASLTYPSILIILFLMLSLYLILAIITSLQQAIKQREIFAAIILPFCFFVYHACYGFGIIYGFILFLIGKSEVGNQSRPWKSAPHFSALKSMVSNYKTS
jgi:glycosyltransferase involved in cell wall biosynthesis